MNKKKRIATITRKTKETDITVTLNLDGTGKAKISTGIGFLDHMLDSWARHGYFDLTVKAKGDLHVDRHHTNEDVAIVMGQAFLKALGSKIGITRFGNVCLPMDEALVSVSLDISGRGSFFLKSPLKLNAKGDPYKLEDAEHFLLSFSQESGINTHAQVIAGRHTHHVIEALFKAWTRALDQSVTFDPRCKRVPSTKGLL